MANEDVRARMVELTTGIVRLHDPDPAYLDLVAFGEDPSTARALGRASGCGLVVRGLWRMLGLRDPRLSAPYKVGSVITMIREMADEAGAWQPAAALAAALAPGFTGYSGAAYTPGEGDVIMLGEPEHVFTVTKLGARLGFQAWDCFSVDGGQRVMRAEAILRRERTLAPGATAGHMLALGLSNDPAPARPVLGCVDLDALAAKFGGDA